MLNYIFATSLRAISSICLSDNLPTWIALIGILGGLMLILISAFFYVFYSQRKMRILRMTKIENQKKIKMAKIKVKNKK